MQTWKLYFGKSRFWFPLFPGVCSVCLFCLFSYFQRSVCRVPLLMCGHRCLLRVFFHFKPDILKMNQHSSVVRQWLIKIVLKHLEPNKSSMPCQWLCVLIKECVLTSGTWQLYPSFCFLLGHLMSPLGTRSHISATDKWALRKLFGVSWACKYSCACVNVYQDPIWFSHSLHTCI